jgi:hypothetical protein
MSITSSKILFGTQFKAYIVANRAARHLRLKKLEKEQKQENDVHGILTSTVCIRGSLVKERFHNNSTSNKIIGKSQRKNPTFYVFTPWSFLYFVGIEEGR